MTKAKGEYKDTLEERPISNYYNAEHVMPLFMLVITKQVVLAQFCRADKEKVEGDVVKVQKYEDDFPNVSRKIKNV